MTTGTEEMLANLVKLEVQNRTAARRAINEGAELFAKNLKANTATDSGELKEHVEVSGFKGGNQGLLEKDIGYSSSVGYRVKYPDTGTIHQRPQNFVEKTIDQTTPEVLEIYEKHIMKGLNL